VIDLDALEAAIRGPGWLVDAADVLALVAELREARAKRDEWEAQVHVEYRMRTATLEKLDAALRERDEATVLREAAAAYDKAARLPTTLVGDWLRARADEAAK